MMDDRQHQIQQILHQANASSSSACMQPQTSPQLLGKIAFVFVFHVHFNTSLCLNCYLEINNFRFITFCSAEKKILWLMN